MRHGMYAMARAQAHPMGATSEHRKPQVEPLWPRLAAPLGGISRSGKQTNNANLQMRAGPFPSSSPLHGPSSHHMTRGWCASHNHSVRSDRLCIAQGAGTNFPPPKGKSITQSMHDRNHHRKGKTTMFFNNIEKELGPSSSQFMKIEQHLKGNQRSLEGHQWQLKSKWRLQKGNRWRWRATVAWIDLQGTPVSSYYRIFLAVSPVF